MIRRNFLAGGAALVTALLAACSKPKPAAAPETKAPAPKPAPVPPAPPPLDFNVIDTPENVPAKVRIQLKTSKGTIVVELNGKKAPITTNNFLRYVDSGKLDGAQIWRAANSGPSGFIQGTARGPTFPPIAHESTAQTGLPHTDGAISMSRFDPGTATADFVFCVGDNTYMDAGREGSDDKLGYATFGYVVSGMDVVRAILAGRISTKKAEAGQWAGQMLATPVKIISGRRLDAKGKVVPLAPQVVAQLEAAAAAKAAAAASASASASMSTSQ
ncbi:MAG TPA: peptidylprolyl isomerase [Asticcacaulis sp.]|nr:peptidylprolyl isomerase [Asticcacaulis sp.]